MPTLPIDAVRSLVRQHLLTGHQLVLTAPPGAGKTTQIPLALMDQPWVNGRKLVMLEPRRLAARAAAYWMALRRGEPVGETVGYRTRFETRVSEKTRIEVVTEDILTRLLQHDPSLADYGAVIFDEFHERSLQADLGLALTLDAQRLFRPDLRIIVMSATLDVSAVAGVLGGAPVVGCEGRLFPVETHYADRPLSTPIDQAVAETIKHVVTKETGSMLVFLPGMAEIRRVERRLQAMPLPANVDVLPLHGDLPIVEQERAIEPTSPGRRKLVLSTAIAETSLTIEGVRVVIDAGLMRVARYDPSVGLNRLVTIRITQDAAEQRRGRAGRVEPGACYRLWTPAEQTMLLRRRSPEILESDLASLVLDLAAWGRTDPAELTWLDPPPSASVSHACDLLRSLGALDERGALTPHGRAMADLPLHPRLAHMLLCAVELKAGRIGCELAALLGERDILRPAAGRPTADLRVRVDLVRGHADPDDTLMVDRHMFHRIRRVADEYERRFRLKTGAGPALPRGRESEEIGLLLASAYPDRIAQRQVGPEGRYVLSNGRGARLPPHDPLVTHPYLVVAELTGGDAWAEIRLAASITVAQLNRCCAEQMREVQFIEWDDRAKAVRARRQRRLGALVLDDQPLPNPDPERVKARLIEGLRKEGLRCLAWTDQLLEWRARVQFLRRLDGPASEWPDLSDEALVSRLEDWLGPSLTGFTRLDQLQRLDLAEPLYNLLTWRQRQELDRQAPTHMIVPSGSRVRVQYEGQEVPVLAVRLQEMFGCETTPRIAGGRVTVMLHLLSPAGRPVQVTQDLAGFWRSSYQDVRKDLRGRYPRHRWPEDPLAAAPTKRAKTRP